jgi:hypothetical protein
MWGNVYYQPSFLIFNGDISLKKILKKELEKNEVILEGF